MAKKRKSGTDRSLVIAKKLKQDVVESKPATIVHDSITLIGNLIYDDELETTTETLAILARNPSLIGLKALKPFKTAVHDYWRVAHETSNTGANIQNHLNAY